MSLNSLKKQLIFSSVETKELVDVMIEDQSKCLRKKPSAILEKMVLDELLSR